jgi:uncharacterized protein YhbP (UPF0306 family)
VTLQLRSPDYPSERLYQAVTRILAANTLCSIATEAEPGHPHIHTAFFAFSADLDLFFLSHPNAAHSRYLSRVPQVAIAVFDSHQIWGTPHAGLQLFGQAGPAQEVHADRARALYAARFPQYLHDQPQPGRGPASSALLFFRFHPHRAKIFDEAAFGDEVHITAVIER